MAKVEVYEARVALRSDHDGAHILTVEGLLVVTTEDSRARVTAIFNHTHATLEGEVGSLDELTFMAQNAARNAATPAAGAHASEVIIESRVSEARSA